MSQPTIDPAAVPRRFYLQRRVDVTGVSGTGIVAHGAMWADGTASVRWVGERPSIVFWDRGMADAEFVHGHNGSTRIAWIDQEEQAAARGRAEALAGPPDGPPGGTRYSCPLPDCPWHHDIPAGAFPEADAEAAFLTHNVLDHLLTHNVLECLTALAQEQQRVSRLEALLGPEGAR